MARSRFGSRWRAMMVVLLIEKWSAVERSVRRGGCGAIQRVANICARCGAADFEREGPVIEAMLLAEHERCHYALKGGHSIQGSRSGGDLRAIRAEEHGVRGKSGGGAQFGQDEKGRI